MKVLILAGFLVIAISASFLEKEASQFKDFKLKHGKTYKNQAEEIKRFDIFKDNLQKFEKHNALFDQGLVTYKKGINQFTDMTDKEFQSLLTLQIRTKPKLNATAEFKLPIEIEAPASADWRQKNVVTGVKNQGGCGSCWAFAVTGSTEGAYALKSGNLVSLSEQQLVDCTKSINDGCDGGSFENTFVYIKSNGLEAESVYPYKADDSERCFYDSSKVITRVSSYVEIHGDEDRLTTAVGTIGPVSVALNANDFNSYSSGIYTSSTCDPNNINHGVLAVGYGSENGQNYWIVKNSWGSDWGENGYIRMGRGTNLCGIVKDAVYPIL